MAAQHRPGEECSQLASAPAQVCASVAQNMARVFASLGRPVPAECAGTTPSTTPEHAPPPPPASGGAEDAPLPLATEQNPVTQDGGIACHIERVGGHRIVLTGGRQDLAAKCVGIRPGPEDFVPARTANGQVVRMRWSVASGQGSFPVVLGARASYEAPATVTAATQDVTVVFELTVPGGGTAPERRLTVRKTLRVVPRTPQLTVTAEVHTRCGAQASVTAEFDVRCAQTARLSIADDFSVSSTSTTSCGTGEWSNVRACRMGTASAAAAPWSLDAVRGRLDPDSGLLTLNITGQRVGYPDMVIAGRTERAHGLPLFPRPLVMSSSPGARRSFGSNTTLPAAGTTSFALDATR